LSIWSPDKKRGFFLFVFFLSWAAGCRIEERWHAYTLLYFDTLCDVKLRCSNRLVGATQEEVRRVFTSVEEHFAPRRGDLNSAPVLDLYQQALQVYRDSAGSFDITVGPLLDLWGFTSGAHRIPHPEEVKEALHLIGMEKIRVETDRLLLEQGMELDWGGIAKGWGVDLASRALQAMGIKDGFINAGGDLYCWGQNPERKDWKIGIKHPRQQGYLGVISATGAGVATSGDYQKYFESGGIRYHHLFDPATGYPARGKQSVTVIGPESVFCDALSTAIFVSPEPRAILDKYPEYGAVLVDSQGNIKTLGKPFVFNLY